MSFVADLMSVGTALVSVVFAIWMTIQLFKKPA